MKRKRGPKVIVRSGAISFTAKTEYVDGVHRFSVGLPRYLVNTGVDLNKLRAAYEQGLFGLLDYMRFYTGLGYSIDGFHEVFTDVEITPKEATAE